MMLIVPVGAMVVGAELRIKRGPPCPGSLYTLPSQAGNAPRRSASSIDARCVRCWMNPITCPAISRASSES